MGGDNPVICEHTLTNVNGGMIK